MRDDWILDVLTDLRAFAEANGLPLLADQLEETRRLALIELSRRAAPVPVDPREGEHRKR